MPVFRPFFSHFDAHGAPTRGLCYLFVKFVTLTVNTYQVDANCS